MHIFEIVLLVIITLLITSVIIISILYAQKKEKYHKNYNFIKPMKFSTGYLKPQPLSNSCAEENTPMYPLWDATVEYGSGSVPDGCPCTEFIQPP